MSEHTKKKTESSLSSSSDSSGEKMLTEERLNQIASWISPDPDFYLLCTEREATDAIKDLLADRKRLERPVADGEWSVQADDDGDFEWWTVTDGTQSFRCAWIQDAEALANLLRRQAREIERRGKALEAAKVAMQTAIAKASPAGLGSALGKVIDALSLNSVETREMKP